MIVCTGGAIWLNPFATMLFNVCNVVTVECCVCTRVACVYLLLCKEEGFSPVSLQLLMRDMGLYEMPLSMILWILGWGLCVLGA